MIRAFIFDCFGVLTSDGWLVYRDSHFAQGSDAYEQSRYLNKQVDAVCEMMFETWDPDPELNIEEPDWYEMYQSSDIPLSEVFTVIGSAVVYKQDGRKARVTLVGRNEEPSCSSVKTS